MEHWVMPRVLCHRYLPVPIPQGPHLLPNDTSKQRASAGPQQELLSQASQPDIYIVCMLVQVHYLVGHASVGDGLVQLSQCPQA